MERDRKTMRLVANALQQSQRIAVWIERERLDAVAREHQLLFLGETDRYQVRQTDRLERRVCGIQLPLAAVDDDQIGKRAAILEHLGIPATHHLLHRRKVVEKPLIRTARLPVRL